MTTFSITAQMRTEIGRRAKRMRALGLIPAVVYGHGITPRNVSVVGNDFLKVYRVAGESSLVDLSVPGGAAVKVLITEVQRDPLRGDVTHIDFREVRMDEKLEAEIGLKFVGESPAAKELGGVLVKNMGKFKVRCLPGALVHEIEVSLDVLKVFGNKIHVSEVAVPEGIEVLHTPDEVVVLVEEPRSEAEITALAGAPEAADVTKVEVATEKKAEEKAAAAATPEKGEKEKKPEKKAEKK